MSRVFIKERSAESWAAMVDSLRGASMNELLLDGPHWTYARAGGDVYRVKRSETYDCGFRFHCTIDAWNNGGKIAAETIEKEGG